MGSYLMGSLLMPSNWVSFRGIREAGCLSLIGRELTYNMTHRVLNKLSCHLQVESSVTYPEGLLSQKLM